ncbi:DNA cytosine methyltransferase [Streptococcus suis]|uniref:DNA cytosine methyltransferase n=1 Tax=Streptococcus suis TaxID=1307 RepID=UPI000CF69FD0|nr:DNA cytosine methyltransferase [Streptococcus suis]
MKRKMIDLFAGCGGLSLGLEKAGFEAIYANEINPICADTYKLNINIEPSNVFVGDINDLLTEIKAKNIIFEEIDLVSGGPPCQGFSSANRQRVIDDPRNILYKSYLEFLKIVKPKFFVMENVKGMANKIDEILMDFQETLDNSYDISYRILNAKNFGVPQNRERFFIIGNRVGASSENIFSNIESREFKQYVLNDAIEGLPKLGINPLKNKSYIENDVVGYLERDFTYVQNDFYKFINNGKEVTKVYNHKNRYNNERDILIYERLPQGGNSLHESISDIMPYKSRNHIFKDKYYKLKSNEVCKTITSHMKYDCHMYIHPTQPRGLSAREAARIQTFPDDFVFTGPQNSWYLQVGNAVPVKLAQVIGEEILKCL